jgi:hypothetical protein
VPRSETSIEHKGARVGDVRTTEGSTCLDWLRWPPSSEPAGPLTAHDSATAGARFDLRQEPYTIVANVSMLPREARIVPALAVVRHSTAGAGRRPSVGCESAGAMGVFHWNGDRALAEWRTAASPAPDVRRSPRASLGARTSTERVRLQEFRSLTRSCHFESHREVVVAWSLVGHGERGVRFYPTFSSRYNTRFRSLISLYNQR